VAGALLGGSIAAAGPPIHEGQAKSCARGARPKAEALIREQSRRGGFNRCWWNIDLENDTAEDIMVRCTESVGSTWGTTLGTVWVPGNISSKSQPPRVFRCTREKSTIIRGYANEERVMSWRRRQVGTSSGPIEAAELRAMHISFPPAPTPEHQTAPHLPTRQPSIALVADEYGDIHRARTRRKNSRTEESCGEFHTDPGGHDALRTSIGRADGSFVGQRLRTTACRASEDR